MFRARPQLSNSLDKSELRAATAAREAPQVGPAFVTNHAQHVTFPRCFHILFFVSYSERVAPRSGETRLLKQPSTTGLLTCCCLCNEHFQALPWLHSASLKTAKLRLQNALRRCAARGQLMRGDQSACAVWRPLASLGFPYNCQTALATCMATLLAACGSGWNSVGEWMHNNVWRARARPHSQNAAICGVLLRLRFRAGLRAVLFGLLFLGPLARARATPCQPSGLGPGWGPESRHPRHHLGGGQHAKPNQP